MRSQISILELKISSLSEDLWRSKRSQISILELEISSLSGDLYRSGRSQISILELEISSQSGDLYSSERSQISILWASPPVPVLSAPSSEPLTLPSSVCPLPSPPDGEVRVQSLTSSHLRPHLLIKLLQNPFLSSKHNIGKSYPSYHQLRLSQCYLWIAKVSFITKHLYF